MSLFLALILPSVNIVADSDEAMIKELAELVKVNSQCLDLFLNTKKYSVEWKKVGSEIKKYGMVDKNVFASYSKFKNFIYDNFTKKVATALIDDPFGSGKGPLFFAGENDELMFDISMALDGLDFSGWENSEITIIERTNEKCIFFATRVSGSNLYFGALPYTAHEKISVSFEDGKWKLDDVFIKDNSFPFRDTLVGLIEGGESIYTVNQNPVFDGVSVDEAVKSQIICLINNNAEVIYNLFYLNHLPFIVKDDLYEENNNDYLCEIFSKKYTSLQDISDLLQATYVPDIYEMLIKNPYISKGKSNPLYVEKDGVLYIDKSSLLYSFSYLTDWEDYSVTVNEKNNEKCDFTISLGIWDYVSQTKSIQKIDLIAVNTHSGLRLNAVYTAHPEYDGRLDLSAADKTNSTEVINGVNYSSVLIWISGSMLFAVFVVIAAVVVVKHRKR